MTSLHDQVQGEMEVPLKAIDKLLSQPEEEEIGGDRYKVRSPTARLWRLQDEQLLGLTTLLVNSPANVCPSDRW